MTRPFPLSTIHIAKTIISTMLLITFLISHCGWAQDDFIDDLELLYGDEETVSVATGSSKAVHLAPSVATVITAEDMKAMGARSLEDALQTVPGLHVSLRDRYSSNYSMRGVHTSFGPQILLLLNGYPYTEIYSGTKLFIQKIPIRNVKRIEIIRGPGSAVFGADAFSGVINIITYDNDDIKESKFGIGGGSWNTQSAWLQGTTDVVGWDLGTTLEWEKSDGDDGRRVNSDLQSTFDGLFSTSASNAPSSASTHYKYINSELKLSRDRWKVSLNSYYQDDTGIGTGVIDSLDPMGNQYYLQHLFEIKYQEEEGQKDWVNEARINYQYLKQESNYTLLPAGTVALIDTNGNISSNPGISSPVFFVDGLLANPAGHDKYYSADFATYYKGFDQHKVRVATGYKKQYVSISSTANFGPGVIDGSQPVVDGTLTDLTGTPSIFLPDTDRRSYYVSIQDEWAFYKDWEITAGLRYDDYSDFGNTINPRLALVWQTNYKLTTKLLYGQAFRAPSISELFVVNNPAVLGNPDLEPEEVDTLELSFDYRHSYQLASRFNIFTYRANDLINFVPDNNVIGSNTAQNALDQEGYGFEFETQWTINDKFALKGNYSWQNSRNETTNADIADAPQQLLYAEFNWQLTKLWAFNTQLRHVADRPRDMADPRAELDDYTLVNLNFYSKKLYEHWEFAFSVHNLFDEDAMDPGDPAVPIDHPLAGRQMMADLVYQF